MIDLTYREFQAQARERGEQASTSEGDGVWDDRKFSVSWQGKKADGTAYRAFGCGATRREAIAEAEQNQEALMGAACQT